MELQALLLALHELIRWILHVLVELPWIGCV